MARNHQVTPEARLNRSSQSPAGRPGVLGRGGSGAGRGVRLAAGRC
jgi:hypothetical protein